MNNKALTIALLVMILCGRPAVAQAPRENDFTPVRFNESGILVEFKTETDPPQAGIRFEARGVKTIKGRRNVAHRVFVDQTNGAAFGYDLEVEPAPVANHFLLTIRPLSGERFSVKPLRRSAGEAATAANKQNPTRASGDKFKVVTGNDDIDVAARLALAGAPKFPPAFLMKDGGMFVLDVLINPQTGVKIVDVIRVSSGANRAAAAGAAVLPTAPDFSPDAVELSVKNFRVLVNGRPVLGAERPVRGGVSGAIIWLHLPGRGRFIFSLIPHEHYGFQKIGVVQGNKISFQIAGDRYEWISNTPIHPGGPEVWVLHDTGFSPHGDSLPPGGYQVGASDRIEYLLKR